MIKGLRQGLSGVKWQNPGLKSKSPSGLVFFPKYYVTSDSFFALWYFSKQESTFQSLLVLIYSSNHFNQDFAYMTPLKLFLLKEKQLMTLIAKFIQIIFFLVCALWMLETIAYPTKVIKIFSYF